MNRKTSYACSGIIACWVLLSWQIATFPADAPDAPEIVAPPASAPEPEALPLPTDEPEALPLPTERDITGVQLMLTQEWPKLRPKSK
jgi:hypothetical protein